MWPCFQRQWIVQQRVLAQPDMLLLGHSSIIMYQTGSGWELDRYWQQLVRRGWSKAAVAQVLLQTLQQLQPISVSLAAAAGNMLAGSRSGSSDSSGSIAGSSSSGSSSLSLGSYSTDVAPPSFVPGKLLRPGVRYSPDKHQSSECLSLQLERSLLQQLMPALQASLAGARTPLLTRMVVSSMPARRTASQRGSGALQAATWCQLDLVPGAATTANALRHIMQRFQISRASCIVAHQLPALIAPLPSPCPPSALPTFGQQSGGFAVLTASSLAALSGESEASSVSELASVAGHVILLPSPPSVKTRTRVGGSRDGDVGSAKRGVPTLVQDVEGAHVVHARVAAAAGILDGLQQLRTL